MAEASSTELQACIDRLQSGDMAARDELLKAACGRLRRLARKLSGDFGRLRSIEDTDDVLQNAMIRMLRALRAVPVDSVTEFFRLAALQIRRELIDLARRHFGPHGPAAHEVALPDRKPDDSSPGNADPSDLSHDPSRLILWTQFHERIESLPAPERAVVDLLWYHGLSQAKAAAILNVSVPTVKRWWLCARIRLKHELGSQWPKS